METKKIQKSVVFKVSDEEHKEIHIAAIRAGVSMSDFCAAVVKQAVGFLNQPKQQ